MNSVTSRLASLVVVLGSISGIALLTTSRADSQVSGRGFVQLQNSSSGAGFTQSGGFAVSGMARVGSMMIEPMGIVPGAATCSLEVFNANASSGSGAICGTSTAVTGFTFGVKGESSSVSGAGGFFVGNASSGNNYGVYGATNSGIGRGVFGQANASGGTTSYGVYGETAANFGRGVAGFALSASGPGHGVYGESAGSFGAGVFGRNTHATALVYGGRFEVGSTTGQAVRGISNSTTGTSYGGYFEAASDVGIGLYAKGGQALGTSYGVFGETPNRNNGAGVFGLATDSTTSINYGTFGESRGSDGVGAMGFNPRTTGATKGVRGVSDSTSGIGVWGQARATSGVIYGVRGESSSPTGFGVYSVGNTGAAGVKSFRIDHPSDPENKYLLHYSSESPTPQNFYSGNVTTDDKGYAWVELPEYFEDINANFKYQLTIVDDGDRGDFVQVKVSQKIRGAKFQIRTSAPGIEVSWRVEADRNDPWVKAYPTKDVVEKEGVERGKYQRPELFGKPDSMSMSPRTELGYKPAKR